MDDLARRIAKLSPRKRALLELQLLKKKGLPEPIAIIGIGCRFPGAPNREAFWHLLKNGIDAITPVPSDRWDMAHLYDEDVTAPGKTYCREGGFLDHVDQFDPTFFGIAPREASFIDPQQRVFLEVVWQAIEDAGISTAQLSGSQTGVFVGISTNDYGQWLLAGPEAVGTYTTTGLASTMAANRLSYLLNLRGPSLAVDTACSSSLVSVHLACQSLRNGESELAIAGGVNLILRPELTIGFSKLTALSPDGRCKAFDADANGFVRSEGAGAIVLKPLSQAIQAQDPIYAVIRGTAINQDGRSNGLTAPNRDAQEKVIRAALAQAGLPAKSLEYVEAHGTGTLLGDPIEVKALGQVLSHEATEGVSVPIGSVKTNIGHTEAAAGIASLIKTALCIKHSTLVPSLHFHTPNPHIPFQDLPLNVQQQCEPWVSETGHQTAGVSAFAFGGTNAHAVLQSAPNLSPQPVQSERPQHLLTLSAKSPEALQSQAQQLASWLQQAPHSLGDICHTLNAGRTDFPHRLAVSGETTEQVAVALKASTGQSIEPVPKTVFLFTGQGSQYEGMGQQLYESQPVFRETVDRCAEIVAPYLEIPLKTVLFTPQPSSPLHQTAYTQPALFVLEYALATLWKSWGIQPAAVLGHSVGEYVAACLADVMSLEAALKLITQRGKLMQSLPDAGAMAAVFADEVTVTALLSEVEETVTLATLNGPNNTVIAGTQAGIARALAVGKARGIRAQALQVSHAFHSPLMNPILPVFGHMAAQLDYQPATIPIALNVTGQLLSPGETLNGKYWQEHARQPVRFAAGLQSLYQQGFRCFLEVGPHPVLCGMGRRCLNDSAVQWLPTLRRGQEDWTGVVAALGRLYKQGHPVNWQAFDGPYGYQRQHGLPNYAFQRQRYWIDLPETQAIPQPAPPPVSASEPKFYEVTWEESPVNPSTLPTDDRWVIFTDRQGVGDAIVEYLQAAPAAVVQVTKGVSFTATDTTHYQLDPTNSQELVRLISELAKSPRPQQRHHLLYLWGLDQSTEHPEDLGISGAGLLHLVQAIAASQITLPVQIWVVTRNTQAVMTTETAPSPMQAPLWGLGSVIALEHPECWGGLIDLAATEIGTEEVSGLIAHCLEAAAEDRVAFRQGQRWGARLSSLSVPEEYATPTMRKDGTYLITGGLGALGLRVAQSLIRLGAKTLVLVSRRGERAEQRSTLAAMREAGATVHVESVDVAEARAVSKLIKNIQETLPPLRGIVHAAGTLADGLLVSQTWQQFQTVMAAKIQGAWNLHRAVKANPLDFFMLFSSAASLLGSPGQGNYAAANAFLDALAYTRRSRGLTGQTLNWGPWQETGLAMAGPNTVERLSARGVESFSPEQGIGLFEQVLHQGEKLPPQVGVLQVHWAALLAQLPTESIPAFLSKLGEKVTPAQPPNLLKTLLPLTVSERTDYLQRYLQAEVARVLGRSDTISVTSNLLDIGLDSLMVMDFLGICRRDLGLTLYPREVFEHPTLETLSRYLAQELERNSPASIAASASSESVSLSTLDIPIWGQRRAFAPVAQKNAPAVFLLSSPRSGSTLLRVMLAGHPALFCPPELHLLPFETLAERQAALADSYLDQGLQRALMALKALDAEHSQALLAEWIAQKTPVAEAYRRLQLLTEARYLVDKSPTYGFSLSTLNRAEALFEAPKYIHLVRHPYGVIDSFVRNRMDKIFNLPNSNPYLLANQAWDLSNRNILTFLADVDPARHHQILYEDLVTAPEAVMTDLCQFLGIPFDSAVLNPYEQQQQRMVDGVNAQSLPIDDPNFHRRQVIDPALAGTWKQVKLPISLTASSRALAHQFGYGTPEELSQTRPAPSPSLTLSPASPLSTMEEQWIRVRGLNLCLCTWGPKTGPPVVCVHGVLNQGAIWGAIAPVLAAQGYRVIAPDLRGHGKSDHAGPEANYQLLDHVGDVDAIVQALDLGTYHLVGHSMGAIIAAALTSARPDQVQSLTLVESIVPGKDIDGAAEQLTAHLNYLAAPPSHPLYKTPAEAIDRFHQTISALSSDWAEALAMRLVEPMDGGWQWRWDARLQVRTRFGLSGGTFTRDRYGDLLRTIQTPTTLVFGAQSDFNRPEDLTFQRQQLRHSTVMTVPGGHHLPLESPLEVAQALLERLNYA